MRRVAASLAIPALCALCFFTGTLVGDSPAPSPKPRVASPNICGTEGDTCPMPINTIPWDCMPTGHEGN